MNHLIKFSGEVFPVPAANSKNHFLHFDWQSYYSLKSNNYSYLNNNCDHKLNFIRAQMKLSST